MVFLAESQGSMVWILLAAILGLLIGNVISGNKVDKTKISALDKDEFLSTMRKGTLIDCRKKEEFEAGKILGAKNYPGKSGAKANIRKDIPIFIYDEKGKAKGIAAKYVKAGAVMVYYLKGGYQSYIAKPEEIKEAK